MKVFQQPPRCCWGVDGTDRCYRAAVWRSLENGKDTELNWCDDHVPAPLDERPPGRYAVLSMLSSYGVRRLGTDSAVLWHWCRYHFIVGAHCVRKGRRLFCERKNETWSDAPRWFLWWLATVVGWWVVPYISIRHTYNDWYGIKYKQR